MRPSGNVVTAAASYVIHNCNIITEKEYYNLIYCNNKTPIKSIERSSNRDEKIQERRGKMQIENGKKLYSIPESYRIIYLAMRSGKYMFRAKKNGGLTTKFIERIMLAVTEVNHCPLCSYGHTKMALEAGMSNEEIQNLLAHSMDTVPADEIAAVLFAQHYADNRAKPSSEAWRHLIDSYGETTAIGILGATRMIMFGNVIGIALSSIKGRLNGEPDRRSSLLYEISILLTCILFLPVAIVHAVFSNIIKLPIMGKNECMVTSDM